MAHDGKLWSGGKRDRYLYTVSVSVLTQYMHGVNREDASEKDKLTGVDF